MSPLRRGKVLLLAALCVALLLVLGTAPAHGLRSHSRARAHNNAPKKRRQPKSRFANVKQRSSTSSSSSSSSSPPSPPPFPSSSSSTPDAKPSSTPSVSKKSEPKSLCVIGATGGLGSAIVREALQIGSGEYKVSGIVRSQSKAHKVFSTDELLNIRLVVGEIHADNRTYNEQFLASAFNLVKPDIVVEVLSNSLRPDGVSAVLTAAQRAKVSTVVVTGGAGQLFLSDTDEQRMGLDTTNANLPDYMVPVTETHMRVQQEAFRFSTNFLIPNVFQLTPPVMTAGANTGKFELMYDVLPAAAPDQVTYGDAAGVLFAALADPSLSNGKMVGLAPRAKLKLRSYYASDGSSTKPRRAASAKKTGNRIRGQAAAAPTITTTAAACHPEHETCPELER